MPIKEACGLFGIHGDAEAVHHTYYGLYAQQHRGQESAGIASADGKSIKHHRGMGLVADVFSEETLVSLRNPMAIGHVRYSTTGASTIENAQPLLVRYSRGSIAVAHNGNLVNTLALRTAAEAKGSIFQTTCDSEVILHLLAQPEIASRPDALAEAMRRIQGAFSLLFLTPDELIAVRDPQGFRPLCLGKAGAAWVIASETCAFSLIGAKYVRDVEPGEIVRINAQGLRSERFVTREQAQPAHCVFEHVYFARPDSQVYGDTVQVVRTRLGEALAKEHPAEADAVVPIPDSGNDAALGFSRVSGIPLEHGFIRNHYVGRTFIQPSQATRDTSVSIKLNIVPEVVRGKRIVLIDDSIIRGTTAKSRIRTLREAGAKEVHMRVSCPPTRHPCYYGIDFPSSKELIAARMTVEGIRDYLQLDSLGYLSLDGLLSAVTKPKNHYCTACYSGQYAVPPDSTFAKDILELKC